MPPFFCFRYSIDEEERIGGGRTTYTTNVAVQYDGSNTWLNPAMFKSICSVDVTNFPFDDQECLLKFGSWAFDKSKIDLAVRNGSTLNSYYIKNGEWQLLNLSVKRNALKYQCCPHEFVDITINVHIRRESLDYILKLIIPCSLISSMIFLGFVLPPESGERIGLSITVLLAMTVFQQLSSELMPSYGFPLLGQYYFACMIEIGASLVVTTLILNFYHRNSRPMPKALRVLILKWLARVAFPKKNAKDWNLDSSDSNAAYKRNSSHEGLGEQGSDSEKASLSYADSLFERNEFKISSTYSDPWIPLQNKNEFVLPANGISGNRPRYTSHIRKPNFSNHRNKPRGKTSRDQIYSRRQSPAKQSSSVTSSSVLLDLFQNPGETELSPEKRRHQKEWIKAARVLDRLFLIVSVLIGVITLLALFLKAPRFH